MRREIHTKRKRAGMLLKNMQKILFWGLKMGECWGNHGHTFCEPIMDDEEDMGNPKRVFWTVFGHYTPPKCGRNIIRDFDTLKEAEEVLIFSGHYWIHTKNYTS
jgi:hypothetical protein